MVQSILRWVIPLIGLLLVGPLAGWCTAGLRLEDGSSGATLLVSMSPMKGLLLGCVAIALATAVGAVGSRLINASYGFFSAGLTLAWAAWGTGTIDDLIRAQQSGAMLPRLAIEGAIVGALGLGAAWVILKCARHPAPVQGAPAPPPPIPNSWSLRAKAFAACLVVAGIVGWFMAPEALKGQTFAAAALAGLLGSLAGKLTARTATPLLVFAVAGVLAVAGPTFAAVYYGTGSGVVRPAFAGTEMLSLTRILPLDWLAGVLVGAPIGLSWGSAMTEPQHHG